MDTSLQFKDKTKIKRKFNFATAPIRFAANKAGYSQWLSVEQAQTRRKSKFSLLSGLNTRTHPPTTRITIEKCSQHHSQTEQLTERMVVAKRKQVDELRRVLSEHKIRIQQTYTSLNCKVNSLKKEYTQQSDRLARLANQIRRFL